MSSRKSNIFQLQGHLNEENILRKIENVLNINEEFLLGENVTIKVDSTEPNRGQGRRGNDKFLPFVDYLQKDTIILIQFLTLFHDN